MRKGKPETQAKGKPEAVKPTPKPSPEPGAGTTPKGKRKGEPFKIASANYVHVTGQKPAVLREGLTKDLCDALMAGNTIRNSCALAGITEATYYRYMQEAGRAEEGSPLSEFCKSVKKALADAEHRNVLVIQTAAKTHWQASAWFLERRYPQEWGRNDKMRLASDEEAPLVVGTVSLFEKSISENGAFAALKAVLKRKPELMEA